jgi:hypothetical protein
MTREEAIHFANCLKNNYTIDFNDMEEFCDMVIKALEQEPSNDCVSRKEVLEIYDEWFATCNIADRKASPKAKINALPPVTPIRPKGHWIEIAKYSDGMHKIECSECKNHIFDRGHANSINVKSKYKYCPNCGAEMSEVEE